MLLDLLGSPADLGADDPRRRHQRQDVDRPHDRRAAARVRAAHRPVHQPAPALDDASGSAFDGRSDRRRALPRDVRRDRAVPRPRRRAAASVPLSFFEVLTGMAFAAFADAPVDVAVVEVGHRRHAGTPPTSSTRRSPSSRPIGARPPARSSATPSSEIAGEKAGIIKPGSLRRARPAAASRPPRCCSRRSVEVGRAGGPRGPGVRRAVARARRRRPAADAARAWRGSTTTSSCRCSGAHQAHNAAVRARRGRGVPRWRPRAARDARPRRRARGLRRRDLARAGSRWSAARRPCCSTPRTTPPARRRPRRRSQDDFAFTRLVGVVARDGRQGRARHPRGVRAGARRGRHHPGEHLARAMPVDELAAARGRGLRRGPGRGRAGGWTTRSTPRSALAEEDGDHLGGVRRPRHRLDRHRRRGAHPARRR